MPDVHDSCQASPAYVVGDELFFLLAAVGDRSIQLPPLRPCFAVVRLVRPTVCRDES